MSTANGCSSAEEIISAHCERWATYENHRFKNLLRISVLRDLARALHAEKSVCLANGLRDEAKKLGETEKKIENLRERAHLGSDLKATIEEVSTKKRSRVLPEALFSIIDREKLERFDRIWEATLIAEGLDQGWDLWALELRVEIARAEHSNKELASKLFPNGLVLFAESIPLAPGMTPARDLWYGRWHILIDPALGKPDTRLHVSAAPGVQESPRWTLLFSAKRR